MTPALPVLGVMLADRAPEAARPLLAELTRHCRPVLLPVPMHVRAVLLLDPRPAPPPGLPLGIVAGAPDDLETPTGRRAAVVLSADPEVLDAAGPRGRGLVGTRLPEGSRPVSPFVRARLRSARGLPPEVVARADADGWRLTGVVGPLPAQLEDTAAALASVVVARTPATLLQALAWGAATVTTAEAALAVGARDGRDVLVAGAAHDLLAAAERTADGISPQAAALVARLRSDRALAARLGWAGRLFAERRHDIGRVALDLADLLGLRPGLPDGAAARELDLLGTGEGSRVRGRVAGLLRGVVP